MSEVIDFRDVYLEELEEQLQMLEEEILLFEEMGVSDEGVQRMFRAAHTLKGSSAAMGFDKMKSLTHEMEHWLDKIRNHETTMTKKMISIFFSCLDRMKRLQLDIVQHNQEIVEISDLMYELTVSEESSLENNFIKNIERIIPEHTSSLFSQAWVQNKRVLLVHIMLSKEAMLKIARLNVIEAQLKNHGEIIWKSEENNFQFEDESINEETWILATELTVNEIKESISSFSDVDDVNIDELPSKDNNNDVVCLNDSETVEQITLKSVENDTLEKNYKSNTIRVNINRLDQLMNYVGELVIEQTRIKQFEKQIRKKTESGDFVDEISNISDQLNRIVEEIQECVMRVRMIPIEQLFNRFPRMVRDLAQNLHKDINLVLEGKETELDRSLIELIGDPLIHLIRNAIDHGIETTEIRKTIGKPDKGVLRIEARHEDNSVVITIQDDGAGIDAKKIRQAAIAKGVLTQETASQLTDYETIQLIFHPGFSTARQVSDVSGRGVGMDIVRTDIERLNGMIEIETVVGAGTAFKIKLPLTLAIIRGLLVNIGKRVFVFPMTNVVEIIKIQQNWVKKVKGIPVIAHRDRIIPLVWLHDYFSIHRPKNSDQTYQVVIIGHSEKRVAIVVDELKGNQEVVIKSLGSFIGKLEGITGATILGDGQVALIVEVSGIFKLINMVKEF